ncbi:cell division protein ZapC [Moritella sp. 5]|uniref:cell division protein ZapC domain-containing protein n=1 Tax=Moritella sp. 5 TaxID=2746231 RepID=UPI001BA5B302|nr:cell division protein ZapC domain-containing protein [Moritella sp. 5]QUM80874.1 cell division protein ZapC [Moritella sp. 5]
MLLEPSNKWYWQYDCASQFIVIQLSDGLAMSCHLDKRNMNSLCKGRINFCAEDSSYYYYFLESLKDLALSVPEKVQIALNGVTNLRFHKVKMPQSWFFEYNYSDDKFSTGDVITLSLRGDNVQFVILEADDRVSTCMLLESSVQLSDSKTLNQFDVIRVMNDRVKLQNTVEKALADDSFSYVQIMA